MGNPLFKASEDGRSYISRVRKDVIESEVRQVSEMKVLIRFKVRPVPGRLTDSAAWQESLLIRRDATLSERVAHVRLVRFLDLAGSIYGRSFDGQGFSGAGHGQTLYPVLLPPPPEGGLIDPKDISGFLQ